MSPSETMEKGPRSAESELAELRETVQELLSERVNPTLGAIAGQAEAAVRRAGDEVRTQADRVSGQVRAQAERLSDEVRERADRLSGQVRERPLLAVGLAALAGFLLASIMRR